MVTKRTRMRFDINDDISLLHEVVTRNPFNSEIEWKQICRVLLAETQKLFSVRSVREHVEHLIKLYKKQDRGKLRKSGTEKQYDDKERLLRKVVELHREFKKDKAQITVIKDMCVVSNEQESKQTVLEENVDLGITEIKLEVEDFDSTEQSLITNTTEEWSQQGETGDPPEEPQCSKVEPLITLQVGGADNSTTYVETQSSCSLTASSIKERFKKLRQNSCLNARNKTNIELQKRKLELEERRIAVDEKRLKLQEDRFQLEKYEREQRLELERKDREIIYKLIDQQKQIIDFFIHINDYRND